MTTRKNPVATLAVAMAAMAAMAIIGAVAIILLVRAVGIRTAAIELVNEPPAPFVACPGDAVEYLLELRVNRPVILLAVSSILAGHDGKGRTVQFASGGDLVLTARPTGDALVSGMARFTVPDLPPGDYQRVTGFGSWSVDSDPVFVPVNFTVKGDCQ